jgi:Fibronectin type III domain
MLRAYVRFGPFVPALLLACTALHATPSRADEPVLAAYNADIAQTSISGISSGAFMAVQFGTAWSSIVIGVGAIAGGPFGCSDGSASAALSTCMGGEPAPDVAALIARTDAWSRSGAIDDTANIARQRIYLFNGYNDSVVVRPVSNALHAFYDHYRPGSLFYQTAIGSGHAQVTVAYGGGCADNGGEFINRCDYDQAGIILHHIYGVLQPRNDGTLGGHVITFRQADFTGSRTPIDDSLDDKGFAYVPAACEAREPCRVHVALHGCLQSYGNIGENFVRHAGYNEWADTNHIIVLYPQIKAVDLTQFGITNPQSCWDWWGYLDADPTQSPTWLLKTGKQIDAIKAMIDRVTSGAVASAAPIAVALAPPATVIAVDASDSAIDLAWTIIPGATGYEVFRAGVTDQAFSQIGTVVGPSYGDAGLKPATAYRYRVRAVSSGTTSDFSAVVAQQTRRKVPPCDEPGTCAVR